MKKFLIAVAAAGLMLTTGCNDNSKSAGDNSAFADSLATVNAQMFAMNLRNQLPMMEQQLGEGFKRESFEKGLKAGMTTDTADIAYLIGLQYGLNMAMAEAQWAKDGLKVNQGKVAKAAVAALNDSTLRPDQLYMVMQQLQAKYKEVKDAKEAKAREAQAAENVKAGDDFVAELKKNDAEVKTTESGLSYKVTEAGDATRAGDDDVVSVIYTGKHTNGEVFDSSDGEPVKFQLGHVVPGFAEGLKLIGKGGKATLYIPGVLAYGANGNAMAGIGPNEMLVFEVELTDIEPSAE
ncbi:MAG: FKBP-type peptidyl-prolyl cis-trans isomerase [Muribaculaceae bacterium]|nr:FKBP-type peptidyl-prolyl cis-trans isomerase [Muribaculaceae bacterium]